MHMPMHITQKHQEFYDFWQQYRAANGRVSLGDIKPKRLKAVLPNIVKIRMSPEGPRFALVGTQVVEEYERDFTGMLVEDHPYDICRETYLSMIDRMNNQPDLVNCHGLFCYLNKHYLRTMESGFALSDGEHDAVCGYLVLVTIDHSRYMDKLYKPTAPEQVLCGETEIGNQLAFDKTMSLYKELSD